MSSASHLQAEMIDSVVEGLAARFPHVHLHVVIDLARTFSVAQLEDAVQRTVDTFPVLGCTFQRRWWRGRWVAGRLDLSGLVFISNAEGALEEQTREWVKRPLDFLLVPPLRIALLEHDGGSRLIVTVHHVVADGAGALTVANHIAAALYDVEPIAPASPDRSLWQVFRAIRFRDLPTLFIELVREAVRPVSLLRVRRRDRDFPRVEAGLDPQWTGLTLDDETSQRFALCCQEQGATINDGFVAALTRVGLARADRGPVATAYTIDTRRFLREKRAIVANLAGATIVVIDRSNAKDDLKSIRAVSAQIGEQKRRLPGLAYNLLPALSMGWLPHGLLRWTGQFVLDRIISYFNRALVVTNIGAMDQYLAPFGDDARDASVIGPFLHGAATPIATATGFRGRYTLNICGCENLALEGLLELRDELARVFASIATQRGEHNFRQ